MTTKIELLGPNPRIVEAVEGVTTQMRLADGRDEDHFFRGAEQRYRMGCERVLAILQHELQREKHNPDLLHLLAVTLYSMYDIALVAANLEHRLARLEGDAYRPSQIAELFIRMTNPRVGDLVLETSTISQRPWSYSSLGVLMDITDEMYDDCKVDTVYHVQPIYYEKLCAWTNAHFVAFPSDYPTRSGPITFTKKELVAALSDAGLELQG